jgi:hypothetical protein
MLLNTRFALPPKTGVSILTKLMIQEWKAGFRSLQAR